MTDLLDLFAGLKAGQATALAEMIDFAQDDDGDYLVLKGYAGTGKTFILGRFCTALKQLGIKVYATATTNKATKVLASKVPVECATIYSLIGLRLADDDEQQRLISPDESEKMQELSGAVVIVDESSMITTELLGHIKTFARRYNVKMLFVGDPAQLPPVEKDNVTPGLISPVWELDAPVCELSEIVRYDGAIEKLAGKLRNAVLDVNDEFDIDHDVEESKNGVYSVGMIKFQDWMHSAAAKSLFLEETKAIALAFTNKQVDSYNNMIRSSMFGTNSMTPYLKGERIVMTAPFTKGEGVDRHTVARNRDEFRVDEAVEMNAVLHHNLGDFVCLVNNLKTCEGIALPVIHPADKLRYDDELRRLADYAKTQDADWKRRKAWADFWKFKGALAQVAYAYAMTTHCSQGSTYEIVFVDRQNIMGVKKADLKTRLQSLYVAATRASNMVITN